MKTTDLYLAASMFAFIVAAKDNAITCIVLGALWAVIGIITELSEGTKCRA